MRAVIRRPSMFCQIFEPGLGLGLSGACTQQGQRLLPLWYRHCLYYLAFPFKVTCTESAPETHPGQKTTGQKCGSYTHAPCCLLRDRCQRCLCCHQHLFEDHQVQVLAGFQAHMHSCHLFAYVSATAISLTSRPGSVQRLPLQSLGLFSTKYTLKTHLFQDLSVSASVQKGFAVHQGYAGFHCIAEYNRDCFC